jgi:hypothetical protein
MKLIFPLICLVSTTVLGQTSGEKIDIDFYGYLYVWRIAKPETCEYKRVAWGRHSHKDFCLIIKDTLCIKITNHGNTDSHHPFVDGTADSLKYRFQLHKFKTEIQMLVQVKKDTCFLMSTDKKICESRKK